MSVIFAGSHSSDFSLIRTSDISDVASTSTIANTTMTDNAIQIVSFQNDTVDAMEAVLKPNTGKLHLHFKMRNSRYMGDTRLDGELVTFYDSLGNYIGGIDVLDGLHRAQSSGNTLVNGTSTNIGDLLLLAIDVSINVTASDITTEFYRNGVLVSTAVASNTTANRGQPHRMVFNVRQVGFGTSFEGYLYFSEIFVTDNDEPTIGKHLFSLDNVSDGFHTDWVGSYTDFSDDDITTSILTDSVNSFQSWVIETLSLPSGYIIDSLCVSYHGSATGGGTTEFEPFVRISSTDYALASFDPNVDNTVTVSYANNPATASAWVEADVNGLESGIKSAT